MKVNKFNDERLQKNLEQAAASLYPVLLILTIAVFLWKIRFALTKINDTKPIIYIKTTQHLQ